MTLLPGHCATAAHVVDGGFLLTNDESSVYSQKSVDESELRHPQTVNKIFIATYFNWILLTKIFTNKETLSTTCNL
jgi:hypothetical protein